jgi:hypothetical protein
MLSDRKNSNYFGYLILIVSFLFTGFACAKKPPSERVAIRINHYTLTAGEFNELFTELKGAPDSPKARSGFLNNLINRKLLLQEAQLLGLDKEKEFLKSVENFWEQSLLTVMIDKKTKEALSNVRATEQELKDYYIKWAMENPSSAKTFEELRDVIKWQVLKEKEALFINSWVEGLKNKTHIEIDEGAIGIK